MKRFLVFLLLFSSCGIETPTSTLSLFAPNGLAVTCNTIRKEYTFTFQALNPESGFSGYNLYYTKDQAQANLGSGQKVTLLNTLPSTMDPTFVVAKPFYKVSNFSYPLGENKMPADFYSTPSDYYFFVRAYDRSAARESASSLAYRTDVTP